MKFALILAGGTGQRMGNVEMPKQFLLLNNKAIILHTLEKFYLFKDELTKIIVVTHPNWLAYTQDLIRKNFEKVSSIFEVIKGGETRNDTVLCGINYISQNFEITKDCIVLTHDAVRPFISYQIIRENIDKAIQYGAVDTVIDSIDTIVYSEDGNEITSIPERAKYYQGQTPQSFKVKELIVAFSQLAKVQMDTATDVAKLYGLLDKSVYLVKGEQLNFKITTPFDLTVAKALLEREG
ncbi:IspD/TarI family cytidylyltransferase [Lysinibacillus pakistanensis]|uniref:IspD/TarI family cytidylyltransferase n=1 Tax=Lysinibacillus pakistanensis TaxID=759811 RepID=UPI003D282F98